MRVSAGLFGMYRLERRLQLMRHALRPHRVKGYRHGSKYRPTGSAVASRRAFGVVAFPISSAVTGFSYWDLEENSRELNFIRTPLALGRFLSAQFRLDKPVDLSVHHCLDIAGLDAGAVVLDHLIRLENG